MQLLSVGLTTAADALNRIAADTPLSDGVRPPLESKQTLLSALCWAFNINYSESVHRTHADVTLRLGPYYAIKVFFPLSAPFGPVKPKTVAGMTTTIIIIEF